MTPLIVGRIVCHVLLCELTDGLVLVDSGFGLADCADHSRIGLARLLLNARFSEAETRYRSVQWSHAPKVRTYSGGGEPWRAFPPRIPSTVWTACRSCR